MMKTPREILLKRHRSVDPKLDRMWAENLSPELRSDGPLVGENVFLAIGWTLWCELIRPSRRIWAGLACAWVVILALNVASSEPATQVANKLGPRSRDEMQSLIEQRRMLAQMIGPLPAPESTRISISPSPRSDRPVEVSTA